MRRSNVVALAALALAVGCATKPEQAATQQGNAAAPAADVGAVRQAIEAGNAGLIAAVEKGDSIAAASFYDDSAMAMPPGENAAVGHAGILRLFGSFAAVTVTNMQLIVHDVAASGDLASETGHYEWTLTPEDCGWKANDRYGQVRRGLEEATRRFLQAL